MLMPFIWFGKLISSLLVVFKVSADINLQEFIPPKAWLDLREIEKLIGCVKPLILFSINFMKNVMILHLVVYLSATNESLLRLGEMEGMV